MGDLDLLVARLTTEPRQRGMQWYKAEENEEFEENEENEETREKDREKPLPRLPRHNVVSNRVERVFPEV